MSPVTSLCDVGPTRSKMEADLVGSHCAASSGIRLLLNLRNAESNDPRSQVTQELR